MLYVTTRVKQDTFSAVQALNEDRGPGGGFFVPMRLPYYPASDIRGLGKKTFSQIGSKNRVDFQHEAGDLLFCHIVRKSSFYSLINYDT